MRTSRRMHVSLLTVALTVFAMAVSMTWVTVAQAAPIVGPGSGAVHPRLTTNTNAGCNTPPKKGYAQCFAIVRTPSNHQITPYAGTPPETALGPADIQDAYNLPSDAGASQTVAIVDAFGYSKAEQDLAAFRDYYGLPPCTTANGCFAKVDQRGGTDYPPDNTGWATETALDLDAVSSACPQCHILLVEGDNNSIASLSTGVDTAVELGAKYVSNSYGAGDTGDPGGVDTHYDHPGVAIVASGGDNGNVVDWPSSIPTVTSVGGTLLTRDDTTERGWTESVWGNSTTGGVRGATGSGCSSVEPKPDYQDGVDTDCDMRATTDIAADADPASGLGIYDTLGQGGWLQVGGTSLSSPLLAAMYALAGTPVPGTYPVTYPYDAAAHTHLFDVTDGVNSDCGTVLCTAGPGWDGPTGWGTPNGVQALTTGPHGDIAGRVTDSASGDPIAGATVSAGQGRTASTDTDGDYDLSLPVGTEDVTAWAYGYKSRTRADVQVSEGQIVEANFRLHTVPNRTLSGVVIDGSGHGWPLYAKIVIDDYPGGAIYSDPYTGRYTVDLAQQHTYTLHVTPVEMPGYQTKDLTVHIGRADKHRNIGIVVQNSCAASGYADNYSGAHSEFTGWTGNSAQDGWTVADNIASGATWEFDNPSNRTPPPGGNNDFAIVDSNHYPATIPEDTDLLSPLVDLSHVDSPKIGFDSDYHGIIQVDQQVANVDLSLDAGQTWTNLWHQDQNSASGHVDIPIPQAAGQSAVQVRFHFHGNHGWWWAIDNVFVGAKICAATPGGLVTGVVSDDNTGDPVNGARVASDDNPDEFGISVATPDDADLSDGFYWLFSPQASDQFTTTDGRYTPATLTVKVAADDVTRQDIALRAGHLAVSPNDVSVTEEMGRSTAKDVTLTNDGTEPMRVKLGEEKAGPTPTRGQPWTDIADYPLTISGNAVASHDGRVYSVGGASSFGATRSVANGYVYDPLAQRWNPIADAPQALYDATATFVNDTMYLLGGVNNKIVSSTTYAYDPSSDSWTQVAGLPAPVFGASAVALNGHVYVVGGCTSTNNVLGGCNAVSKAVYRYDPGSDSWTRLADYPTPVVWGACAGITGGVVCAGGRSGAGFNGTIVNSTYIYDPISDTWNRRADMPYENAEMAYSGANDKLQVAGGVITNSFLTSGTSRAAEYDPVSNTWTALPSANHFERRGGGGCGLYKIGGATIYLSLVPLLWPHPFAEVLPGYDECGGSDVSWLSEDRTSFELPVGQSVTVTITMDSAALTQPGDYAARLAIGSDTPYSYRPVDVAMHVDPPQTWGKLGGTVTDAETGSPIGGAAVHVCTVAAGGGCGPVAFTLETDRAGQYQRWLDTSDNPLQVSVAKDDYQPQLKRTRIARHKTTTVDFALKRS